MHHQDSPARPSASSSDSARDPRTIYEDEQRGLLDLLLDELPNLLTYREALVARVKQPEHPIQAEDFDSAARALAESGLIVREGQLLMPSRAVRAMVALGYASG